ncbi:9bd0dd71-a5d0-4563-b44b-9874c385bbc9 [Sclerotinia trifoliorum]|uniref:9bd0dd71-a5d0-4563-b44b-9874c385bbc9 n=1 Tax=Sclerotinia trifoliorum TaxID=28548 RepID=A0A8H2ZPY3_9HELO|nr:9bd0dd71-a5d0-4563-b44b-9874c385bbc9 [Sclerotinia trifoliorum]
MDSSMVATLANELTQKLKRNEERKQKQDQNVRSTHRAGYSEDRPSQQRTPQKRAHDISLKTNARRRTSRSLLTKEKRGVSTKKRIHGTSSWSESQNTPQTRWSSVKKFVLQCIDQIIFMIIIVFVLVIIYNGRQNFKQWVHRWPLQPMTIVFSVYNTTKEHIIASWEKIPFQLFQSVIPELGNEPKESHNNGQNDDSTAISPNIEQALLEGGLSVTRRYPSTSFELGYIIAMRDMFEEIGGHYINEADLKKILLEISLFHEAMGTAKRTYEDFLRDFYGGTWAMYHLSHGLFVNTQNTYNEFEESTKKKRQYGWEILFIFSKKDQPAEVAVEEIKLLFQQHITLWFEIIVGLHEKAKEAILHFQHLKRRISGLNLIMEPHQNMLYDMMKEYPEHSWTNSLAIFFNHENLTREAKGDLAEFLADKRASLCSVLSLHDHNTRATAIAATLRTMMENCNTLMKNCYEISNNKAPGCSLPYIPMSAEDLSKSNLNAIVDWAEKGARRLSTVTLEAGEIRRMEFERWIGL